MEGIALRGRLEGARLTREGVGLLSSMLLLLFDPLARGRPPRGKAPDDRDTEDLVSGYELSVRSSRKGLG
jgi:hypothetical protein